MILTGGVQGFALSVPGMPGPSASGPHKAKLCTPGNFRSAASGKNHHQKICSDLPQKNGAGQELSSPP